VRKTLLFTILHCLTATLCFAFPDNGVLDTFTAADGTTPPNANWTNATLCCAASPTTVWAQDNAATTHTTSTEAHAYWNPATFGANQEAYAKAGAVFGSGDVLVVFVRLVNIGAGTTDGYGVLLDNSSNNLLMFRSDDGAFTALGSGSSVSPAVGDQFGMTAIGDQLCSYFKSGAGAWTQKECVEDGTYVSGGRIGINIANGTSTDGTLDDFGGGDIASSRRIIPPFFVW
jgi:hypothetical protein